MSGCLVFIRRFYRLVWLAVEIDAHCVVWAWNLDPKPHTKQKFWHVDFFLKCQISYHTVSHSTFSCYILLFSQLIESSDVWATLSGKLSIVCSTKFLLTTRKFKMNHLDRKYNSYICMERVKYILNIPFSFWEFRFSSASYRTKTILGWNSTHSKWKHSR